MNEWVSEWVSASWIINILIYIKSYFNKLNKRKFNVAMGFLIKWKFRIRLAGKLKWREKASTKLHFPIFWENKWKCLFALGEIIAVHWTDSENYTFCDSNRDRKEI